MRELTHALTQPGAARAALAMLAGVDTPEVVEALVELLARPHTSLCALAVAALDACENPLVVAALVEALDSPLVPVRQGAVEALARRRVQRPDAFARLLRTDPSWVVRRAALRALAGLPGKARWLVLAAADDPHWRVRHALIGALRDWGQNPGVRREALRRLGALPAHPRVLGVRDYLLACWTGDWTAPAEPPVEPPAPWWDPDPAVLVRNLEGLGPAGRRAHLGALVPLLGHDDERVQRLAVAALRRHGEAPHLAAAFAWLDDPRSGAGWAVHELTRGLELDRREAAARQILRGDASPAQLAWAISQVGVAFPAEEERPRVLELAAGFTTSPTPVRAALVRLAARWPGPEADGWLSAWLADPDPDVQLALLEAHGEVPAFLRSADPRVRRSAAGRLPADAEGELWRQAARDPDARVRQAVADRLVKEGDRDDLLTALQADPHPLVRGAALTPARAAELAAAPVRETSWHVLSTAARLARVPAWEMEPQPPWRPPAVTAQPPPPALTVRPGAPPHARALGPHRLLVAPAGLSGHYGLAVEGFVRAVEAGVNLLFWEPNYQTLTAFAGRLAAPARRSLHFLAGTFEAAPARVRKDLERALQALRIEQLAAFLLFWTRSWDRLTDELRSCLDDLVREGKAAAYGLSTHDRTLAVEALAGGWDPVMVRHSAAHRGAEREVFPRAVAAGVGLITFNNTCYGRLLRPRGEGRRPPAAADCYRFSLAQPGVAVCLSAPATLAQLEEDLEVLRDPSLPEGRRRELEAWGAEVYRDETLFRRVVRSR